MKVFLTGGTGFIGRPLARALLGQNWSVTALVRSPAAWQARYLDKMGVHSIAGDIADRESMRAGMTGVDIVINTGGAYEYGIEAGGRRRMTAANVNGVENVLSLAMELGIPRSIHVSTVQAFGDSGQQMQDESFERQSPCRTWYEKTKTEGHAIARRYQQQGLPVIIACPNGVIGANDHSVWGYFLRLYINKVMPPLVWSSNCIYTLVDVDDLVQGLVLAAEKGRDGETYLFTGEAKSFREHLSLFYLRPGGAKVWLYLPSGLMAASFWPMEPLQRIAGLPAFMSRETTWGARTNFNYSSEKAQKELGWTPMNAEQMWLKTIDGELELLAKRKKRDLVSRLNPVELDA